MLSYARARTYARDVRTRARSYAYNADTQIDAHFANGRLQIDNSGRLPVAGPLIGFGPLVGCHCVVDL